MKRILLLCLFVPFLGFSQTEQWASRVIDFSSELTSVQYSAEQVLGKPNVLPLGGESPNAWTPARPKRQESITVGFDRPMKIRQIMIAESYNPSAITEIYTIDTQNTEHLITSKAAGEIPLKGRIFSVIFDLTTYNVAAIRIEFDGSNLQEFFSIDAIGITDSPVPYTVELNLPENLNSELSTERLSNNVNSPYKEYAPILSPDGKTLFFSRQNHPENTGGEDDPEDVWFSELDENGEWKLAQNASTINTDGPNFVSAVTPDGNSVVLILGNKYNKSGRLEAGISFATKEGDEWGDPEPVEILNDYNYNERAHYFMSNNRQVLFMAVERDDTNGGLDLYVTFLMDDGRWEEPKNIGKNVNTAADELAPFLAADDKTLYFSSNGYSGYGAHDIYVTRRLDDTWLNWSDPENMGPKINTEQEDVFFYIPVTGNYAYYSRGVSETDTDIYRVALPLEAMPDEVVTITGTLKDSETGEPIGATIIYERLSDGRRIGVAKSDPKTGNFEIILPLGEQYGFLAEADGYVAISENIDLRNRTEGETLNQDLKLVPIAREAVIVMNNVFFDFDKSIIKPESKPELDRIYDFMNKNPNIKIELAGHADATGDAAYNLQLSQKRAESVKLYLVNKGISSSRMDVKYFGESQPAADNGNRQGRRLNRRVEFKIIED